MSSALRFCLALLSTGWHPCSGKKMSKPISPGNLGVICSGRACDYSLHHPLFGVGLGQFPNFEGTKAGRKGRVWELARDALFLDARSRPSAAFRHSYSSSWVSDLRSALVIPRLASGAHSGIHGRFRMPASAICGHGGLFGRDHVPCERIPVLFALP